MGSTKSHCITPERSPPPILFRSYNDTEYNETKMSCEWRGKPRSHMVLDLITLFHPSFIPHRIIVSSSFYLHPLNNLFFFLRCINTLLYIYRWIRKYSESVLVWFWYQKIAFGISPGSSWHYGFSPNLIHWRTVTGPHANDLDESWQTCNICTTLILCSCQLEHIPGYKALFEIVNSLFWIVDFYRSNFLSVWGPSKRRRCHHRTASYIFLIIVFVFVYSTAHISKAFQVYNLSTHSSCIWIHPTPWIFIWVPRYITALTCRRLLIPHFMGNFIGQSGLSSVRSRHLQFGIDFLLCEPCIASETQIVYPGLFATYGIALEMLLLEKKMQGEGKEGGGGILKMK